MGRGQPYDTTHLAKTARAQALGHKPTAQLSVMGLDTEPESWVHGRVLALLVHGILGKSSTLWSPSFCFCSGDTCLPCLRHD